MLVKLNTVDFIFNKKTYKAFIISLFKKYYSYDRKGEIK